MLDFFERPLSSLMLKVFFSLVVILPSMSTMAFSQDQQIDIFLEGDADSNPINTTPAAASEQGTQGNPFVLTVGSRVDTSISSGGDTDFFEFTVVGTQDIRIESASSVDLFGELRNLGGELIASDDDGGEGFNFEIVTNLTQGRYVINVRGFNDSVTGSYSLAVSEASSNSDVSSLPLAENGEFQPSSTVSANKTWEPGQVIRIAFLNGTQSEREAIIRYASEWTEFANLNFEFVDSFPNDIRINIDLRPVYSSLIGTDANDQPDSLPTMNLGFSGRDLNTPLARAIVLHEFGHALGLIHEHQNPQVGICWNRPVVYDYYQAELGWDTNRVDRNIFGRYAENTVNATRYDPMSIMHYAISRDHLTCDQAVELNLELSDLDKAAIAETYPGNSGTSTNTTTTNNDNTNTNTNNGGSVFVSTADSGGGGGCQYIAGSNHPFDPTLPLSLLFSLLYISRKRVRQTSGKNK